MSPEQEQEGQEFVCQGAPCRCDKGTVPSPLQVTSQQNTYLQGKLWATSPRQNIRAVRHLRPKKQPPVCARPAAVGAGARYAHHRQPRGQSVAGKEHHPLRRGAGW
jgi:hypothetical protein